MARSQVFDIFIFLLVFFDINLVSVSVNEFDFFSSFAIFFLVFVNLNNTTELV